MLFLNSSLLEGSTQMNLSAYFNILLGLPFFLSFIKNIIHYSIKFCNFLLFADDMRSFKAINNIYDRTLIQGGINSLQSWCSLSGVVCNTEKCFNIF